MNTETNKQIARQFLERLDARDIPGTLTLLSDDVSYWIAGKRDVIPTAGVQNKTQMARIFTLMDEQLKSGLRMQVKNAIAEGDQVALEIESHGELHNGRVYNNEYHMLFTIRDGKIVAVKEYLDTQHVKAIWFTR